MKGSSFRAWTDINSLLRTHKLINFGLIIICTIQLLIIAVMYFEDPIVVVKDNNEQSYFTGNRKNISISEDAVKSFVRKFLRIRYEWQELAPNEMSKALTPITTKGLNKKLYKILNHLKTKEFQDKSTSQSIVNIDVSVTKEKVVASFDKLLKIEGIPIPVPTIVSLNIIRGSANSWNPIGLYVNGVIEHQVK